MRRTLITSIALTTLIGCQTTIQTDVEDESTKKVMEAKQSATSNTIGQFTVFDGARERVVESSQTTVSQTAEILARVMIPANQMTAALGQNSRGSSAGYTSGSSVSIKDITDELSESGLIVETVPGGYETISEAIVVQEASTELITIPATFETVTETIVVQPQSVEYEVIPTEFETYMETVIVQEASPNTPAITRQEERRRIKTPASTVERVIPAITKQVERRVVKTPASTRERVIPAEAGQVQRRVKKPDSYVIRDKDGNIVKEFPNADEFASFQVNPYKHVSDSPVSTFSADVDTASYSFVRQFVKRGQQPPTDSVRIEEMVNYFDYDYAVPDEEINPFKPSITIVPSPWNAETRLVHIGVQGFTASAQSPETRPDMNLVFLIDVSGSMNRPNKLPLLKKSFEPLIKQLGPDDKVSIVTYAGQAGVALVPTSGRHKQAIRDAIDHLGADGSTAGAAGIQTAYELAAKNFDAEGTNRVILATDGDFNVGLSGIEALKAFISDKRDSGIYLSVLGFGQGNLKDHRMQALAQNGNGIAGYIDSLKESRKFFTEDMTKNMLPIANDLKLQVEFNPERVAEYRLLGYETRALKREDFKNDKVDAGDVGQGHAVTAIYEVNPKGLNRAFVDPLRYGQEAKETNLSFVNEFGFLKIRYKKPGETTSHLMTAAITDSGRYDAIDIAPQPTRFAVAVAAYGLKLRGDRFMDGMSWESVTDLAMRSKGLDPYGHRAEFVELTRSAQAIEN